MLCPEYHFTERGSGRATAAGFGGIDSARRIQPAGRLGPRASACEPDDEPTADAADLQRALGGQAVLGLRRSGGGAGGGAAAGGYRRRRAALMQGPARFEHVRLRRFEHVRLRVACFRVLLRRGLRRPPGTQGMDW